ncbi:putative membrane protein [Yersinia pestis PY-66]|uniref:Uncharacterized protein n=5 Tax=Yersinia pestis TaxID=632 RepID=Q8CL62_YERPE|nr:hypothetical [Yersinia pestis KIM10+]ABG13528.1 conserved hypothetical protein [Yersinia pestis Antiqua]ABG18000.1 conserved hypothetical protein [Yersinia pestis Nepal516]ABP39331.1 conserved hypothetical protein [Yersinia pestis Pestoides F]ABX87178.1 putative membrane protein [Yersinia pestis Angola]ADV98438.1 hypothetical protein YPC_1830 [Yersinia pestis biovar Medievalis str. Harbin 35]EDR32550.1 putative membrane protein [Yersinia pestis biovar Orientalis str. IP275]EDR37943.1 puta
MVTIESELPFRINYYLPLTAVITALQRLFVYMKQALFSAISWAISVINL